MSEAAGVKSSAALVRMNRSAQRASGQNGFQRSDCPGYGETCNSPPPPNPGISWTSVLVRNRTAKAAATHLTSTDQHTVASHAPLFVARHLASQQTVLSVLPRSRATSRKSPDHRSSPQLRTHTKKACIQRQYAPIEELSTLSRVKARIGERSMPPMGGMMPRKAFRYGSQMLKSGCVQSRRRDSVSSCHAKIISEDVEPGRRVGAGLYAHPPFESPGGHQHREPAGTSLGVRCPREDSDRC